VSYINQKSTFLRFFNGNNIQTTQHETISRYSIYMLNMYYIPTYITNKVSSKFPVENNGVDHVEELT